MKCSTCSMEWPPELEYCPADGTALLRPADDTKTAKFNGALPVEPGVATVAPSEQAQLSPGTRVGEYIIEGVLGEGGMSTVYAARQPLIGRRVAIKILHERSSPAAIQRFIQEARAVNEIRHPNIIDVFSFGNLADGRAYMVMEALDGETLSQRLERGPVPVQQAIQVGYQVAEALTAAHAREFVHRDLKPDNIFLLAQPLDSRWVKLLDFGVAKLMQPDGAVNLTQTGVILGTPAYLSPEQAAGDAIDYRTDIYALGIVLYESILGARLFTGTALDVFYKHVHVTPPEPQTIWPGTPPELNALIMTMLAKRATDRPALPEVRDHLKDLHAKFDLRLCAPKGITITERLWQSPTTRRWRVRKHQRRRLLTGTVATLIIATAALLALWPGQRAPMAIPAPPVIAATNPQPPPPPPAIVSPPEVAETPATPSERRKPVRTPPAKETRAADPAPQPASAPTDAYLTVFARPWVSVEVDGQRVARETPLRRHRLTAGRHQITFVHANSGFRAERRIEVEPGKEMSFFVDVTAQRVELR